MRDLKNRGASILLLFTLIFVAFTVGFFIGRSYNHNVPQIQVASPPTVTAPQESEPTAATEPTADALLAATTEPTQPEPSTEPSEALPEPSDAPDETSEPTEQASSGGKININTATADQLTQLPGIGPTLAQRIVAYRTAHGAFSTVSELKNVYGIGDKKVAALSDYATAGG